ncbi:MAG TPA: hypothetical protein VJ838_05240 [Gaiellaceae bacterium]|nr:hypothetical protein [Gaiellaceae bacterium]
MIWITWRQQRIETLISALILALLAVAFIPAGIHLADLFAQQHLARCVNSHSTACGLAIQSFSSSAGTLRGILDGGWFNLIPGLIGVALAAPLLLDLEHGTIRLAWTQSVTRRRWIATKLGVTTGTVLVAAAAFSALLTWYQQPLDRIYGRWDKFDFEWIVPLGYAAFALGLALGVGVIWRKSAAAIVVAFAAYVAARLFVQSWLRQRFVTPRSATWGPHSSGPRLGANAWVLSGGPSDRAGHVISGDSPIFRECVRAAHGGLKGLDPACMANHGAGYNHIVWQPASRFWEFQGIETALFGSIALLLLAFSAWWLRRRVT